jgi:hypothetical protein
MFDIFELKNPSTPVGNTTLLYLPDLQASLISSISASIVALNSSNASSVHLPVVPLAPS